MDQDHTRNCTCIIQAGIEQAPLSDYVRAAVFQMHHASTYLLLFRCEYQCSILGLAWNENGIRIDTHVTAHEVSRDNPYLDILNTYQSVAQIRP